MAEQESEYVKLISSDGFEFIIHREAAMRSGTMKNMLSGAANFTESLENQVTFRDIKAIVLETACRYLYYKWQNEGSTAEIPEFVIEPELALETLMAADFLDCKFTFFYLVHYQLECVVKLVRYLLHTRLIPLLIPAGGPDLVITLSIH